MCFGWYAGLAVVVQVGALIWYGTGPVFGPASGGLSGSPVFRLQVSSWPPQSWLFMWCSSEVRAVVTDSLRHGASEELAPRAA